MTQEDYQINSQILIQALDKGTIQPKRCDACAMGVIIGERVYGTDTIENRDYAAWAYYGAYGTSETGKAQCELVGMTGEEALEVNYAFERAFDKHFCIDEGVTAAIEKMNSYVCELHCA